MNPQRFSAETLFKGSYSSYPLAHRLYTRVYVTRFGQKIDKFIGLHPSLYLKHQLSGNKTTKKKRGGRGGTPLTTRSTTQYPLHPSPDRLPTVRPTSRYTSHVRPTPQPRLPQFLSDPRSTSPVTSPGLPVPGPSVVRSVSIPRDFGSSRLPRPLAYRHSLSSQNIPTTPLPP